MAVMKNSAKTQNAEKDLWRLVCHIEKCLDCYKEFKEYPKDKRVRLRRWHNMDPWFFPPREEVKGFFGTGRVFLVCERPSTGTFPDEAVELFYRYFGKYGLGDAHITYLIKCRSKVNESKKGDIKEYADKYFNHLLREIEILNPKMIVAVGENVYRYLEKKFDKNLKNKYGDKLCRRWIIHYSYAKRIQKEDKLMREIKKVKDEINKVVELKA